MRRMSLFCSILLLTFLPQVVLSSSFPSFPKGIDLTLPKEEIKGAMDPRFRLPIVLFDETHKSNAGNADWTVSTAYSDFADLIRRDEYRVVTHMFGEINERILAGVAIVVLPEPNKPFSDNERLAIQKFVKNGGGLLMIADHTGSDRDHDGWDSVDILNRLGAPMGLYFHHRWFTEVPLRGPVFDGPLTQWVRKMGIWGGTTVGYTTSRREGGALCAGPNHKNRPILAGTSYGRGRVVALGDSSPFDDGTGEPQKKLHDSFNSFLYDIPQMGSNIVRWLGNKAPRKLPPPKGLAFSSMRSGGAPTVLFDASHFNEAADKTALFRRRIEKAGHGFEYCDLPMTADLLDGVKLIVIDNPADGYKDLEVQALSSFVRGGGSLLLSCRGGGRRGRGRQKQLNALLQGMGATLRFSSHQVFDDKVNYGRPWSLAINQLSDHPVFSNVKRLLFWNPCPVVAKDAAIWPAKTAAVMEALPSAYSVVPQELQSTLSPLKRKRVPLIGEEQLGKGLLFLMGTCTYTDYQYTEERRKKGVREAIGVGIHQTPLFNSNVVDHLIR